MEEYPIFQKQWKKGINTLDVVYPNKYYGGVYSLAPLIVYNIVNQRKNWLCKRIFLDRGEITSKLVGFTFQYEMDYFNFFRMLRKFNIPLERNKRDEIIFAGGPCVNANHKTLSRYIDFFFLGDCEETISYVLDAYDKDGNKKRFLEAISSIKGIFVPEIKERDEPSFVENLDSAPYPLYQPFPNSADKKFVFGRVFMLEIERGCPFSCKFCLMPIHKKLHYRSFEKIKDIIDKGIVLNKRDKVIVYSASFTNPERKKILKYLVNKKLQFSVPSLNVEVVDEELLKLIKQGGQKTLTVAPEANERIRLQLGKFASDDKFFSFAEKASKLGFEGLKSYFMVGLPGQSTKDLEEMVSFIKRLKEIFPKLYVSINPFVPKPKTVLGQHRFDKRELKKQASFLKKELAKISIRFKMASINNYFKQWKLAHAESLGVAA